MSESPKRQASGILAAQFVAMAGDYDSEAAIAAGQAYLARMYNRRQNERTLSPRILLGTRDRTTVAWQP